MEKIDEIEKEILKGKIKSYFKEQEENRQPLTLPGLAMHLSVSLSDLVLYPQSGALYSELISYAKQKCENDLLNRMFTKEIPNATGLLLLKNHFGYLDLSKAVNDEERRKQNAILRKRGRSISDILDDIEKKIDV